MQVAGDLLRPRGQPDRYLARQRGVARGLQGRNLGRGEGPVQIRPNRIAIRRLGQMMARGLNGAPSGRRSHNHLPDIGGFADIPVGRQSKLLGQQVRSKSKALRSVNFDSVRGGANLRVMLSPLARWKA